MSKEKKLAKKEAKAAKKEAKAEKALAKANAKAEKKHAKAYEKFVKETTKKNEKGEKKAAAGGKAFTAIAIPTIDAFQTKGEIKAEKAGQKAYAKLVKKIDKKNAKLEKKCAKKGKPFVPIPTPSQDEMAARPENKGGKIVLIVILILLIWFLIYFIVRFGAFVYNPAQETTAAEEGTKVAQVYDEYSNPHKITTTPDYSIADAKLRGANLREADLCGADLCGAKNIPFIPLVCPEKGSFTAFKKCNTYIIELLIPEDAKRSSATTRKCRASCAKVVAITDVNGKQAEIDHVVNTAFGQNTVYKIGEYVYPDSFDEDRWNECSHGIHFFMSRQEAVEY